MSQAHELLAIADWLGSTKRTGVELGPPALARLLCDPGGPGPTVSGRHWEIHIPEPDPRHAAGEYERTKYLPEIASLCRDAHAAVRSVYDAGRIPIAVVGNDSAMMGVLSGVAVARGPNVGVAWWDAHGDINTPATSPSGKLYGMPLAHLLGHGDERLLALNPGERALDPDNVVLMGARCLDEGELSLIEQLGVGHYTSAALMQAAAPDGVVEAVTRRWRSRDVVELWVHLDLDVLDPALSPGVSMHEPDGLSPAWVRDVMRGLFASGLRLAGLSVSEYNPAMDRGDITRDIALGVIGDFIAASAGLARD